MPVDADLSDPFVSLLDRLGSRMDAEVLETTVAHWKERHARLAHAAPARQRPPVIEDIAYGPHARNRLDVFPVEASGAPMVLFVHGGGFIAGDKRMAPPFYANIGHYFAAHGIVCACMNYRLAPTGGWPAAAEDVAVAAQWLQERGDLYGGDTRRLFIMGQSAGACHVATWLLEPRFAGPVRDSVRGALLMSGLYEAQPPLPAGSRAYFGEDATLYPRRSPATMVRQGPPYPLLLTISEMDPPPIRQQGQGFFATLQAAGVDVALADLPRHNHVSALMSLGSGNDQAGARLRAFITGQPPG
jgi:acetyl esterase/lipase